MTLPAPSDPRTARWRYHFTDFRTGRLLATLPMTGVSLSDVLKGAATGTGTVPLAAEVRARDPFRATVIRRSCCWAERQIIDAHTRQVVDSRVPWAGIVMRRERASGGRGMKLSMVTWPSYFQRRLLGDGLYTQRDKFWIMRTIFAAAVQQPAVTTTPPGVYGNSPHLLPLDNPIGTDTSGVLADRTYLATDLKPVLEAAVELGNSGDGFDWRMAPFMATAGDLGSFRVRLDLGYPRLGRVAPAGLRWSTDRADARRRWGYVEALNLIEDGAAVNNKVTAVGTGTGTDQIRAVADSTQTTRDEMAAGYPLYEGSAGGASNADRTYDTVYSKARGALLAGFASEVQVTGVKVRGDLAPAVTSYDLGDDLTIRVGDTLTGTPTTIIGQLVGRTIEPAEQGRTETVTLDLQGTTVAA